MQVTQSPSISPEALKHFEEAFGKCVVSDPYRALFDQVFDVTPAHKIAKESKRVTEVSLHAPGDVVEMSDGSKYRVDDDGKWIRIKHRV